MTEQLSILSLPRITWPKFLAVLTGDPKVFASRKSPMAPWAYDYYRICYQFDIDPSIALAFAFHEHQLATDKGLIVTHDLRNWGSVRTPYNTEDYHGTIENFGAKGNFARYSSWDLGLRDWCERIHGDYIIRNLTTVDTIIPRYAPASENDTQRYIEVIYKLVNAWA